jgi:SnoaL-like domain
MSEENVELARRVAEMFNRRDFDGFLALMAQDVRFQPQLGPISIGHDGMRRLLDSLIKGADLTVEVVEVRDLGADGVLANVRQRGRAIGVGFDDALCIASRWRQGECVWWGAFLSEEDAFNALEAAGLSE